MSAEASLDLQSAFPSTTLVDLLRTRAIHQSDQKAYTFLIDGETEEVHFSYGELDKRARSLGSMLQELKADGQCALLVYPPGLDFIAAFFGCLYASVVAVPVYPPDPNRLSRTLPRLQAIAADARAKVVLTTSPILAIAEAFFDQAPDLKKIKWLATDSLREGLEDQWKTPELSPQALAFLQYTSGSTGHPRGVIISHANLLHNVGKAYRRLENSSSSRFVSWLPVYHDMGLIGGILQPLYGGFPCTLMSPLSFLQRPVRWLQAITDSMATISTAPNFAYDLCVRKISEEEKLKLDLRHWELAMNGSEPVRPETMERFVNAFQSYGFRREAFYPCYGLAEATLMVSGGLKSSPPVIKTFRKEALQKNLVRKVSIENEEVTALVGCGHALEDQRIVIVDPETLTACSSGQIGEIWVSGPSVAQGYWYRPQETKETFEAYISDSDEGPFLRTGDLGFLRDHELFITGRLKDLIIIRGQNHYPQDIEQTVEKSHPVLRPGCGAAFSVEANGEESLVVVHELERREGEVLPGNDPNSQQGSDLDEAIGAINDKIYQNHELQPYAIVLIKAGTIPKTSSGKIQRHACKKAFLSGALVIAREFVREIYSREESELRSRDQDSLKHWLIIQIAKKVGVDAAKVDPNKPISCYGLDSLAVIELSREIETKCGASVATSHFFGDVTIAALASEVSSAKTESHKKFGRPLAISSFCRTIINRLKKINE